ncbi:MAG: sigma-54 dependent transcriptional regulator [Desulfohalobiaceae bacterium]|nr:sigma-54 dependent transcriptional regulator [Desulfohalobiaceae bacterium]
MQNRTTILVVDDEEDFAKGLTRMLAVQYPGYDCRYVTTMDEALEILRREEVALVLTDLRMPGKDGWDMLAQGRVIQPETSLVVITAYGSIDSAVQALKSGAYDFLTKPVDEEHLFTVVDKVLERYHLLAENRRLRRTACREGEKELIGESPAMRKLRRSLERVAATDYTVLIQGESGTGKELAARMIHNLSERRQREMVTVNCPAIPGELLESELFGHVRGAFTGAERNHQGLFERADKGTLLLDEIGDISAPVQTKLLRVLQEQEIRPVGSNRSVRVDVRVVATTNQNLEERIARGEFREDLFYRLNVLNVNVPSLRERKEDIPLLVNAFLGQVCGEMGLPELRIDPSALSYLSARDWQGNVRELLNFIRRLVVFCPGEEIELSLVHFLDSSVDQPQPENGAIVPYKEAKARVMDEFTRTYVRELLRQTRGNISEAARMSGLERVSLQKIMRRLDIRAEDWRGNETF